MFIPLTCTFYRILSSYARKKKKTGNTTYYKQMLHSLLHNNYRLLRSFLNPCKQKISFFFFLHLQTMLPEGKISGKCRICIRGKGCQTGGYGFILGSVCKIYIPQGFRKSPIDILSAPDTLLIIAGEIPCGVRFLFIGRIVAFKALRQNVFKGLGIGSIFLSA